MSELVTVRSFVNTWECDENAHLNVQFYFQRFEAAQSHFLLQAGLDGAALGPRAARHVRYHSEMHAGDLIEVRSSVVDAYPGMLAIAHRMFDSTTGGLAATALDSYARAAPLPADFRWRTAADPQTLPRSQTPEPSVFVDADDIDAPGAHLTNRSMLLPRDCDENGLALDRAIVSCFSDGAAHAWNATSLDAAWFGERNMGRVAMEMKLTVLDRFRAGTPVTMITRFTGAAGKVFTFRHVISDARTGRAGVIGDVTALVMDMATRKAIALPAEIVEMVEKTGHPA